MERTFSRSGEIKSNAGTFEKVILSCRQIYRIEGKQKAIEIHGLAGRLWITCTEDPEDYLLEPGKSFGARCRGLILVQGLPEGVFWYHPG